MNFQQLRAVREALRHQFNLTAVAQTLHTSQPGVSRQIRELETELGVDLFVRMGKRLTGLTDPGQALCPIIDRLLHEADNLQRASADWVHQSRGTLTIAATHSQARYALPHAVRDFSLAHPEVALRLHQGSPHQVAEMLLRGDADIGIATEALASYPDLLALPCYQWTHSVIVPMQHPLLAALTPPSNQLTLAQLTQYPLITYEAGYTGRAHIDAAFAQAGLQPNIVLEAMDADVIKTYVQLGLGVGIVAAIATQDVPLGELQVVDAGHLFAPNLTRLAVRRSSYLRSYVYRFIESFAPPLTQSVVQDALRG